jgi:hypothetical protein
MPFVTFVVPRTLAPLVKVTVPVTFEGSVAVNTTDWLGAEGLIEDESVSAGKAFVTI